MQPFIPITPRSLVFLHRRITIWYEAHGRKDLPWRRTSDPYVIYISEVMLQQTQVKTVLERYYYPFLDRFPSLRALAAAPLQDVLKAWEGLGYYSRARNLHRAAAVAGGELPRTVGGLLALPGVGKNTAHAVASFGFSLPVPVVEANVKRVLARVFALKSPRDAELWEKAELLLNKKEPFIHNQAMMDIGALICTPRRPDCPNCPLLPYCAAARICPEAYPARKSHITAPVRERNIIVLQNKAAEFYLEVRTENLLKGLYGFPQIEPGQDHIKAGTTTYSVNKAVLLGTVTHTYSHFKLVANVLLLQVKGRSESGWYGLSAIGSLPISRVDDLAMKLLRPPAKR